MPDQTTDWLKLANDAYSASNTYFDASIRSQIEQDLRQFQGVHPAGSKYLAEANRSRSRFFRPKTRTTIRKNEAVAAEAFFSTVDTVSVSAEDDSNPMQQASAAVHQHLLQYRLTKSIPWFLTCIGAYQDALTVGVVASYQGWEYNTRKGIDKPCVRLIALENLRFDPGADWTDPIRTSPYVIELVPMYIKDVRARMTEKDQKTGEPKWKSVDQAKLTAATKQYGDSIRLQREQGRTDPKDQTQSVTEFSIVWVHKNIVEVDGIDYMYYTLGVEELLSDPVPLKERYFHGKRPYVLGYAVVETHKNYPSSLARISRDVQGEINDLANQRMDNVKFALNKRYFVKRGAQVDLRSIMRNVAGSATMVNDPERDIKVVDFADVTGSSYQEQDRLNLDFDDVTGTFSGSSVQSNRQMNETVGGLEMLTTDANQVSGYQLRTFVETWVEPVLRQLILLEQYYETDEKILAMAGKNAGLVQKFGINAVTDELLMQELTLNVNVGMGATNPVKQVNQFLMAMNSLRTILADGMLIKYGLNVEEVIKELFGKLGYRDGGRFFNMGEQDPVITGLQNTITELQQALSQKVDPELVQAQVRKIDAEIEGIAAKTKSSIAEAIKKGVEAQFSAMQSAEVVAAVPAVAPIADSLLQSAGYQPSTTGVDPNIPQPAQAAPGLAVEAIKNHHTGVDFTPGDGSAPAIESPSTTLSPLPLEKPATPGLGVEHGIQTTRPDSA